MKNRKLECLIKHKKDSLLNRKINDKSVKLNSRLEAVENGKILKYIASQFNVCIAAFHKWMKYKNIDKLQKDNKTWENLNIRKEPKNVLKLKIDKKYISSKLNKKPEAIEMYLNGIKLKDIAAQFNVSIGVVHRWVKYKDDLIKKKYEESVICNRRIPERRQVKNKIRKLK